MKQYFLPFFLLIVFLDLHAQKPVITIGCNFVQIPDSSVELRIESNNLNYVDIMDYRVLKILKEELSKEYDIRVKLLPQSGRTEALLSKDTSQRVDLVLFSYSDSYSRRREGIEFSEPYFVNNSGIAIFTKNEHLKIKGFERGKHEIAVIKNATADFEVRAIAQQNKKIKIIGCDNYEAMVDSLRSKKACMIVADLSRMCYFLDKYSDVYYADLLKAAKASTGEGFCVAIRPGQSKLRKKVDEILQSPEQKDRIDAQEKLLENKINQALETQTSVLERQLKSNWILFGVPLASLLVVGFILFYFLRRRNQYTISDSEYSKIRKVFEQGINNMLDSAQSSFDKLQVLENGIECLMTCKSSILYVGSGGFMSSPGEEGDRWRKAIYDSLNRGIKFTRIVDLPERNLLFEKVTTLEDSTENTKGKKQIKRNRWIKKKSDQYITRFYAWLAIQYLDLRRYETNLTLWNSRSAAFWGIGNIMLFKDMESVLVFASTGDEKMGTLLKNANLVRPLWRDIHNAKDDGHGKMLTADDIKELYFEEFLNLKNLLDDIYKSLGKKEVLDEQTMNKIQSAAAHLVHELGDAEDDVAVAN